MLRLRNVGRDSQQTKRCRRGDTVTDTTANIIGVHIFAIDDAALDGIPDPDAYIVSLSGCRQGRSYTRQYGPVISSDDKASIEDRLRGDIRLIGTSDVIWYALELMRLCPKLRFRRLLSTRSGTARLSPRFKVHVFHDCTLTNRQRSMTIATECYMNRYSIDNKTIEITAPSPFVLRCGTVLPIFRMKWAEIQGNTTELQEDWKLADDAVTAKDKEHTGSGTQRYTLIQSESGWQTHVMHGTRLVAYDSEDEPHEVDIIQIKGRVVKFTHQHLRRGDIQRFEIIRGGESLHDVMGHLAAARKLLCTDTPVSGALQFMAAYFSLPSQTAAEWRTHVQNEEQVMSELKWPTREVVSRGRQLRDRRKYDRKVLHVCCMESMS